MILAADPRQSYLNHKVEIDQAVHRVLESGWYIHGEEVETFEQEFAAFLGAGAAVGTGSGTEALHLALRTCGVGPGDFVLTVSHTAVATVAAIELAGGRPILVDVDPDSYTMDPNRLAEAITEFVGTRRAVDAGRLKAVIPVHLYGHPADMSAIMSIANQQGLMVIEDCAQAHGAVVDGRMTGTWGAVAAYSFYPTKNLGALGDAGALVTSSASMAERAKLLREYGWRQRYVSEIPGMNSRLDSIQAAVLRVKLRFLEQENEQRRAIAALYSQQMSDCVGVDIPEVAEECVHVFHQYVIRARARDQLKQHLESREIGSLIHYPIPIHLQPAYRTRLGGSNLQNTERICAEILSLPISPHLSLDQVERVASVVRGWCEDTLGGDH